MSHPTQITPVLYCLFLLFLLPSSPSNAYLSAKYEARNAEECRKMVNSNYDALIEQMRNSGSSSRSIRSIETRGRNVDLQDCRVMLEKERLVVLDRAYNNLSKVLETYRTQGIVSEQNHRQLAEDYALVKALPKSEYVNAYLRLHADYLRYKSTAPKVTQRRLDKQVVHQCVDEFGKVTLSDRSCLSELSVRQNSNLPPATVTANDSSKSCRELKQQAREAKQRYKKAISSLIAIDPDSPSLEKTWKQVDRARVDALSDFKYHLTRAAWADCAIADKEQPKSKPDTPSYSSSSNAGPEPFLDLSFAAGRLLYAGEPGIKLTGSTVTLLKDGSILQYGGGFIGRADQPRAEYLQSLRSKRRSLVHLKASFGLWDAKLQGWIKLAYPEECPVGARLFQTATLLEDGKVLFAGGICDTELSKTTNRYSEYKALSLWDPEKREWLSAPELSQSRLYHSASLLKDGSVLFVGGEGDPGVYMTPQEPVTKSVERYIGGKIEAMPSLNVARAKHTATVRENGCVVISGGFDQNSQPVSAVEQWCPGETKWRLISRLETPRYDHTATLLKDGRIIVVGGKGIGEQTLNSTEIWLPAQNHWVTGPSLPLALHRHDATRLSDGRILIAGGTWESATPWAWVWDTQADYWVLAGNTTPQMAWNKFNHVRLFPRDNGRALLFTADTIMYWEPLAAGQTITTPVWKREPAAIEMRDGRLMMVGEEYGDPEPGRQNARIWNPGNDRWQYAGSPGKLHLNDGNLIELDSGQILLLLKDTRKHYYCYIWKPNTTTWRSCGTISFKYKTSWPPNLGFLSDGRVIALINKNEAYVYNPFKSNWHRFQVEWNMADLTKGSPVRVSTPMTVAIDPASGKRFEINDLGSRMLWPRTTSAFSMLWNKDDEEWSYVLPTHEMGLDTHFLPDGCAISSSPLAIFNPKSGEVRRLADPGFGIQSAIKMLVLKHGDVIFTGEPKGANDPGNGIFHAHASCDGISLIPGRQSYFSSRWLDKKPHLYRTQRRFISLDTIEAKLNKTPDQSKDNKSGEGSQVVRFFALAHQYKSWLVIAIVILLSLALLHFLEVPYFPPISKWLLRLPIYTLLAIYIVPPIWFYLSTGKTPDNLFYPPNRFNEQNCQYDPKACLDSQTGLLVNLKGESRIPCHMVGDWTLRQKKRIYRIRFKDDGSYIMTNSFSGSGKRSGYRGYWAVQDNYLVWRHYSGPDRFDINEIIPVNDQRFKVIEMNGTQTVYDLINLKKSTKCTISPW
ncbi:MAG: kelch repeat-containing protein [Candidatus Thiodiazotropha sp.]